MHLPLPISTNESPLLVSYPSNSTLIVRASVFSRIDCPLPLLRPLRHLSLTYKHHIMISFSQSALSSTPSRDNEYGIDDETLLELKYKAISAKGAAYCMYIHHSLQNICPPSQLCISLLINNFSYRKFFVPICSPRASMLSPQTPSSRYLSAISQSHSSFY